MPVEIFRVFSVVDGYTVRTVETEEQAQALVDANEEYDYESVVEYW